MVVKRRVGIAVLPDGSELSYRAYIDSKEWAAVKRRYRESKLSWRCRVCGAREGLHLHHKTYKRLGNEYLRDLVPLCQRCHKQVHRLPMSRSGSGLWNADKVLRRQLAGPRPSKKKLRNRKRKNKKKRKLAARLREERRKARLSP